MYKINLLKKFLLLMGDAALIFASFYFAPALRFGKILDIYTIFSPEDLAAIIGYLFIFYIFDLYNLAERFIRGNFVIRLAAALVIASICISAIFYIFRVPLYSVSVFFLHNFLIFCFCLGWRIAFGRIHDMTRKPLRLVILGAGEKGKEFHKMIKSNPEFEVVGFLDDDTGKKDTVVDGLPVIGNSNDLPLLVSEDKIDKVVVAITQHIGKEVYKQLIKAKFSGVTVYEVPTFAEMYLGKIPVNYVTDTWITHMPMSGVRRNVYAKRVKRIIDIALSVCGLLATLPFMFIIWVVIKLDSPGPALFIQTRIGWRERPFHLVKFRSMRYGMELERSFAGSRNDPRITRIGKSLRLFRLDELPQLWNVLKGDMSFIGPRALMKEEVDTFDQEIPYFALRHSIRPGITGWAQVNYKHGASMEDALEKLQYDLYYLKNMSFLLDLHIMLRTVRVVLFMKGAR